MKSASSSRVSYGLHSAVFAGLTLLSCTTHAEVDFKPYAETLYEYNSNVFALRQDTGEIPVDDEARSDRTLSFGAGFNLDGKYGRQEISLKANAARAQYQKFDQLDHDEYGGDAEWTWKLGRIFDGTVGYGLLQRMVPFADTQELTTQLLLEKGYHGNVDINVAVTPVWRLETKATFTDLDSPRPGAPELQQDETLLGAGLKYVGIARLSAGLEGTSAEGEVTGLLGTPDRSYKQSTLQLAANYQVSGKSNFAGNLGYTKRNDDVTGDVDAVTGQLSYTRALTRKTSVNVQLNRLMNSYLINTDVQSEITTGINLGVNWQATAKTGFALSIGYQQNEFPGESASAVVDDRKDDFLYTGFDVNYQITRWLLIHPFVRYEDRDSNDPTFVYDNTVAGIQLKATLQ